VYWWDWSDIENPASVRDHGGHTPAQAVDGWTDSGHRYLPPLLRCGTSYSARSTSLVTRNRKPWLLVEAKTSDTSLSPPSPTITEAGHRSRVQVVKRLPFEAADWLRPHDSVVVPARTCSRSFHEADAAALRRRR